MILSRDLITALGIDIKYSKNDTVDGEGPCKGCTSPMVDLSKYNFYSIMFNTKED